MVEYEIVLHSICLNWYLHDPTALHFEEVKAPKKKQKLKIITNTHAHTHTREGKYYTHFKTFTDSRLGDEITDMDTGSSSSSGLWSPERSS